MRVHVSKEGIGVLREEGYGQGPSQKTRDKLPRIPKRQCTKSCWLYLTLYSPVSYCPLCPGFHHRGVGVLWRPHGPAGNRGNGWVTSRSLAEGFGERVLFEETP